MPEFTGKERDVESTCDYFLARHYCGNLSRRLTPDWSSSPVPVPFANLFHPQSLNLYAYVGNNPLNFVDSDGHAGKQVQVEGHPGYTVRFDKNNPNDFPNVHLFKSGQEVARGKMGPDGVMKWDTYKSVNANALSQVENMAKERGFIQAALERQAAFNRLRAPKTGVGTKVFIGLQLLSLIIDGYFDYKSRESESETGFHTSPLYGFVVTDINKAAQHLPSGTQIWFQGQIFTLRPNGTWTNAVGDKLVQDPSGRIRIQPPMA